MMFSPETVGIVAATLTTLSFAPQAFLTLKTRDTRTLSLGMYAMFVTGIAIWLWFGILKHETIIIVANVLTLILAVPILSVKIYNRVWGNESL
jgi:MtN3 and saliva related transmembrane protein